jgi:small subunit ribosomal protein S16
MVVIRMARGGMKKTPYYRVVAADKRDPRDGRFIEKLGFFNPVASGKAERLKLDLARVDYWISQGAQLSDRVSSLVKELRRSAVA